MIRVAIAGASGYTGAELVRLLVAHPAVEIVALTAGRQAGKAMADVFPHLYGMDLPSLCALDDVDWGAVDVAFLALPHGASQQAVQQIGTRCRIIDLSADFRLKDADVFAAWYGDHAVPALLEQAVYGLTEMNRAAIKAAQLVANPGCYPTATVLALWPLLAEGVVRTDHIVIDAKSGVSGAGRKEQQALLFTEVSGGLKAYGIGHHRHMPEIAQGLEQAAGGPVGFSFTPHLIPMSRGMMVTAYVAPGAGKDVEAVRAVWADVYADSPFVSVLPAGIVPATATVSGTNRCHLNVFPDRVSGRAIVVSVIDNLVKGASGQAVQNMNVMLDQPEKTGLDLVPVFP